MFSHSETSVHLLGLFLCFLYNFSALRAAIHAALLLLIMLLRLFNDKRVLASVAAEQAATAIQRAIAERAHARIIAATGTSQFEFLEALTKTPNIDWTKVEMFHLDEYIGLSIIHVASFRKFLIERLIRKTGITHCHLLDGEAADLAAAIREASEALASAPVDIAFLGIGENGHIAFNDPPADFNTEDPYLVVTLDQACRMQQVGEGWFADISQVPQRAITMSPSQILKAKELITIVPDKRKAQAVKSCLEGDISPMAPASILRRHANAVIYLDQDSASLLSPALQKRLIEESQVVISSQQRGIF